MAETCFVITSILSASYSTSPSRPARYRFNSSSTLTLPRSNSGAGNYRIGSLKSGGICYQMPGLSDERDKEQDEQLD